MSLNMAMTLQGKEFLGRLMGTQNTLSIMVLMSLLVLMKQAI